MLLTIKELSAWLNIKPSTLYVWASQGKIPCRRIHGLIRFEREAIQQWLEGFEIVPPKKLGVVIRDASRDLDELIAAAKRDVYTPRHGETRPTASPKRREVDRGAR
jgi:excisionase family DNA binding protein